MGTKAAKTIDKADGVSKKLTLMSSKTAVGENPPKVSVEGYILDTCCEDSDGLYMTRKEFVGTRLLDPWKMWVRVQPCASWAESLKNPTTA
jgi:hypothetical protein